PLDLRAVAELDRDVDLSVVQRLDPRPEPLDLGPVAEVDRDGDPRLLQRLQLGPQPRGVDVEADRDRDLQRLLDRFELVLQVAAEPAGVRDGLDVDAADFPTRAATGGGRVRTSSAVQLSFWGSFVDCSAARWNRPPSRWRAAIWASESTRGLAFFVGGLTSGLPDFFPARCRFAACRRFTAAASR